MSFRDDLRKKLGEEVFNDVVDKLGDNFNLDLVPRTRLNEVIRQRDEYKSQLADPSTGTQQQNNQSVNQNGQGQQVNHQQMQNQQPSVEELRKQWEAKKDEEISALKIRYAGLDALRAAGSVDPEVAFSLLDQSKLTLDDKGAVVGLNEQITAQKESKKYLYTSNNGGREQTPDGTGKTGDADQFGSVKSKEDFLKLSYDDQIKFKQAHPIVFAKYLES